MSLKTRIAKLEKNRPSQAITLFQAIHDPDLSTAFLAQHGIEPAAEIIVDKTERELERLIAEAEGQRRLPNGLKLLTPEAQVNDRETET